MYNLGLLRTAPGRVINPCSLTKELAISFMKMVCKFRSLACMVQAYLKIVPTVGLVLRCS